MVRLLLILTAVAACLGAALAYGAAHRDGGSEGERLLTPVVVEAPPATTTAGDVQLRFRVPPRAESSSPVPGGPAPAEPRASRRQFRCRVDGGGWRGCSSPLRLTGLVVGAHRVSIRVYNWEGRVGEATTVAWQQVPAAGVSGVAVATAPPGPPAEGAGQPFSITALKEPEDLYPGFPAIAIPVRISNPAPVPIEVTALGVAVAPGAAGCGPENFATTAAAIPTGEPVRVPAEGSVDLPTAAAAAPSIQMLDLPVDQDACQGLSISLVFSGEARG